jgi:hypothetical protein
MRLTPSCVAVFLSLCFDSFEYRPNACKTSSVVIGVVRIFAKCQRIVYFFANIPRFRVRVAHDEGRNSKTRWQALLIVPFFYARAGGICIAISIMSVFTADIPQTSDLSLPDRITKGAHTAKPP